MNNSICRRLMAMFLAAIMIVGIVPATVFADGETPETTETQEMELLVTEPEATEPEVTEPEVTEPEVTEPEVTEPEVTEPEVTEPEVTEPEVTEPEVTEPEVTEPEVTEPEVTEPEVTEPEVTEPEVTEPEVTEPEVTEPEVTEPEVTEPEEIEESEQRIGGELVTYNSASDAGLAYDETVSDYYNVISKQNWELAPGIHEAEIVLNNDEGSQRQVLHVVSADVSNEYVKVMPSYAGMKDAIENKNYQVQVMSKQTAWAEANGYGNIVAAMNISLSWYDSDYYKQNPHLIGEPLGYLVMDGSYYENSRGKAAGAQTCAVINFDEKDGEARPADMPKVEIRSTSDPITGWEEQVIPANFGWLVKDGKNLSSKDHNGTNGASRSFMGIKEDGTFIMVMNDGRQAPYSTGLTSYEMGEVMLSLGCVAAVNGDGGGSSTFLSQRPGEEMALNCKPSDGSERPTTHGIFVITTAPSTGEFVRANITTENQYFTPGSTVQFKALGTDMVGTEAAIPAEAAWQIKEEGMGTIENGVFVSNGTVGTATAQLVYNGEVVGEHSIEIVIPETFAFGQSAMTVPFGKTVEISMKAAINGGLNEVVLQESDVLFTLDNTTLGTIDGFTFTAAESAENTTGVLTAALTGTNLTATAALTLGKGSEILFDFEESVSGWHADDVNYPGKVNLGLSHATSSNGQVHDGNGSLRFDVNTLESYCIPMGGYAQESLYLDKGIVIENAKSIGFWAYIPDETFNVGLYLYYFYDSNGDGTFDKKNTVTMLNPGTVFEKHDEDGWHYFSADISAYDRILLTGLDQPPINPAKNEPNNYRFIEVRFPHTNADARWKENGSLNGPHTFYFDNITVDYSDAVDDREAPVFGTIALLGSNESETAIAKRTPVVTTSNTLDLYAAVSENTAKSNATGLNAASAKAYIDGVEVTATYSNGRIYVNDAVVADGMHRVKFEICDNAGNKSVVVRLVNVQSGADTSTVQLAPRDAALDRLYGGSVYWMDLKATNMETIQSVKTVIDINGVNHWELDHMELAPGFTADYSINDETNTATITVARTGKNTQTGEAVLASLPIRIIYFDTDIYNPDTMLREDEEDKIIGAHDAQTFWNEFKFWPQDLKVDVDLGVITYVDGYTSNALNTFSNEEFRVDTEMYAASDKMDPAFIAERGTCHVHTAAKLDDKAATCTEVGYTGRTYCEICDSVVAWGTTVPVQGHTYELKDGQLVCDCGDIIEMGTGLFEVNGQYYYSIAGNLTSGWQLIGEDYYFFDGVTFSNVEKYDNGVVTFTFEPDGKLTSGQWHHTSAGSRYYYGPDYYKGAAAADTWAEIDGKQYCFPKSGYAYKGHHYTRVGYKDYPVWYDFGTDGAMISQWDYTGIAKCEGYTYFVVDGVTGYGMHESEGEYYYSASGNQYAVVTNLERYCPVTNGVLPAGTYRFGADGKMLNNDICNVNGALYYFVLGKVSAGTGTVEINGQTWNIGTDGKVDFTGICTDANGKTENYVNGVYQKLVKNGVYKDDDGEIRYYENDVAQYAGLVRDADGNYYYINSSLKAVKNRSYTISAGKTNGLLSAGTYAFDAEGKMIDPPVDPEKPTEPTDPKPTDPTEPSEPSNPDPDVKNGLIVDADGEIRYYKDGVAQYAGLVQDEEGNYYYINSSLKAVKNRSYGISAARTNGLLSAGTYQFGEDGKMVNPPVDPEKPTEPTDPKPTEPTEPSEPDQPVDPNPDVKNGLIHDEDGNVRFYKDGVAQYAGLVQDADGSYYYINSSLKAVKNRSYTISAGKTNGLLSAGTYQFGEDGKMVNPPVDPDKPTEPTDPNPTEPKPTDPTEPSEPSNPDPDVKNGLIVDADGEIRYYKDGVAQYAGLVQDENGNYYYINSAKKAVKNRKYSISTARANGLMPAGTYSFGADGKMILE